ncbi:hypothetical protein GN956_G4908 [Arapaima gigas]
MSCEPSCAGTEALRSNPTGAPLPPHAEPGIVFPSEGTCDLAGTDSSAGGPAADTRLNPTAPVLHGAAEEARPATCSSENFLTSLVPKDLGDHLSISGLPVWPVLGLLSSAADSGKKQKNTAAILAESQAGRCVVEMLKWWEDDMRKKY